MVWLFPVPGGPHNNEVLFTVRAGDCPQFATNLRVVAPESLPA